MMQTAITDEKEQAMLDASRAMAALTDLMVAALPESAREKVVDLLNTGANLVVNVTVIPFPSFTLLLLPANRQAAAIELVACAPSGDTVRALGSRTDITH